MHLAASDDFSTEHSMEDAESGPVTSSAAADAVEVRKAAPQPSGASDPHPVASVQPAALDRESHNTLVLVLHQVLFRVAWVFKTESVLMPAFLDSITTNGWLRGMLPPLNRLAQSITPLFLSGRLRDTPVKSHWLPRTTFLMGLPFLILGALLTWLPSKLPGLLPVVFLTLYTVFFALSGLNQAVLSTVHGKLIAPHRRGRLMAIVGYTGSPVAIVAAWFIMQPWVEQSPPVFGSVFLFTGFAFLAAGCVALLLAETADNHPPAHSRRSVSEALYWLRRDQHLRRMCLLSSLVAFSMVIFPHYQRIGREMPGYAGRMLLIWVICQNLGAALFSWLAGRIADRRGTRAALRLLTLAGVIAPIIPLLLRTTDTASLYWITFIWLGIVPVTARMQLNYVLELTDQPRHPIYVSTTVLCTAPPILLAPLVGEIVARFGCTLPFSSVACISILAFALTLLMIEPRQLSSIEADRA